MSVTTFTAKGITGAVCDVAVDLASGLPSFDLVGLADGAVREARVRVRAALAATGVPFPAGRVAAVVAPAPMKKEGTGFDLPIAVAVLAACGVVQGGRVADSLIVGELALDGRVRPVRGAIVAAERAKQAGKSVVLVAAENGPEAAVVSGVTIRTVRHLRDAIAYLNGDDMAAPEAIAGSPDMAGPMPDLQDVRGQPRARRMLEVAAAGGHHILLVGGPGAGKTMLARRLPGILPTLTEAEAIEVTRVSSVAGLNIGGGLVQRRPFRAPHHSTSAAGLIGGGVPVARPGELSLAHHGVLFLDELPEFHRSTLDMLSEPLATGEVQLSRAAGVVTYPARALVAAAMNPCPCGQLGHPRLRCRCTAVDVARYRARIVDRLHHFDVRIDVPPLDLRHLADAPSSSDAESSAVVRERVSAARARQMARQGKLNADLGARDLGSQPFDAGALGLMARAVQTRGLTARDYERVRRVALTVADLDGADVVSAAHAAEAVMEDAMV